MKGLSNTQMRAGMAAVALGLCMLLPWYRATLPRSTKLGGGVEHDNLTAFGAFSWVEAAVLLVAGSILYLLYARSQRRGFHLPGGDGWAVTIAGAWTIFLLIWRLFDRPDVGEHVRVGVQWGLFATLVVAVALLLAGQALRAEHKPEPPNPAAEDPTWETPRERRRDEDHTRRLPVDSEALTQRFADRPAWEGEPPPPPSRAKPAEPKPPPEEGKLF